MRATAQGKDGQAKDLNRRICEYHNSQPGVLRCKPASPINGQTQKVIAILEFESLDAMAKYWGGFFREGGGWDTFKDEWDGSYVAEGSFERYQFAAPD